MFNKTTEEGKNIETVIGAQVKMEGDFQGEGDVTVEGEVKGTLKTKGNLIIKEGAKIQAEVSAKNAKVSGEIHGNITVAEKIELASSAKVVGDIVTGVISVESGALIEGHCSVTSHEPETKTEKKKEE